LRDCKKKKRCRIKDEIKKRERRVKEREWEGFQERGRKSRDDGL